MSGVLLKRVWFTDNILSEKEGTFSGRLYSLSPGLETGLRKHINVGVVTLINGIIACGCYLDLYEENSSEIRSLLMSMSLDLPHYTDLEWRLEAQLSSRSLERQVQPSILLRLHTEEEGVPSVYTIETDPVNLIHLTNSLETALAEIKSQHCRRLMRGIK
uniref:COMM domain-containing protein n=1 Tax=Amphimedon queenslandica TaxID=400682 RepID=A0A1X7UF49_AMPQE